MTSLKIYLQQSHRFQDFSHSEKSAKKQAVQRNKLCSKMHKAISTKVQGKTSFETELNYVNQTFLFSNFYVIFGFLTQEEKD